ncbi:MAG: transaldolase [Deltaproteobacteria bacterium]|nr:transaldolase [Deltaproteobacteria bacterium]MBI2531866.1 transaldolase [Deltaproteobacteria bacterium]
MGLRIKIFADGANLEEMRQAHGSGLVKGFTTNPTLMRKAGVTDYEQFARSVLREIQDMPISFEVFSDDIEEMARQARTIAAWGKNVYVKIPVTNTQGQSTASIVRELSREGIRLNITALLTLDQVRDVCDALDERTPAIVSLFAGRVADTGRDPVPMMREGVQILRARPLAELLWASPREILNLIQADETGCHIITMTSDLLNKMSLLGTELEVLSLQTVKMFHDDAAASRYRL